MDRQSLPKRTDFALAPDAPLETPTDLLALDHTPERVHSGKQVIILQNALRHYRAPFYELLRARLRESGVRLRLLHGRSSTDTTFSTTLPWAEPFESVYLPRGATWHPVVRKILKADLLIVEHASKHLLNYVAFLLRKVGGPKLAFWGHGWSHACHSRLGLSERTKRWIGRRVDWYFAYTATVREGLIERGYDARRITDVQNAVAAPTGRLDADSLVGLIRNLGLEQDSVVALFCGQMYPRRPLDALLAAAEQVHRQLPSFVLVLAGGGPRQSVAETAARRHDFIHYVGPVFGEKKAALFSLAQFLVMPGPVGLGIVDAFHHGVPPLVTRRRDHGPEIGYLQEGVNGLRVDPSAEDLTEGMLRLSTDGSYRQRLIEGCRRASQRLTVEAMAERFAAGIIAALEAPGQSSATTDASTDP